MPGSSSGIASSFTLLGGRPGSEAPLALRIARLELSPAEVLWRADDSSVRVKKRRKRRLASNLKAP